MCGYDNGLAAYEAELDRQYIMDLYELKTEDDYYNWLQDQKESALIAQYEDC